ncbi:MAG: AraC family transcriptional regulator [Verrucomicrobia bacterium]|nr:AraC family transcriptional regulator [Verrucomicrobiota bacterium]
MSHNEGDLLKAVGSLDEPDDYFTGIDWGGLCLPRNILCFSRQHQAHETEGWSGISAQSGRYDQHSRFVLLVGLDGAGRVGVETEVWRFERGEGILMFPHQVHYYMDLPERFCWLYVTFEMDGEGRDVLGDLRDRPRTVSAACQEQLTKFLRTYEGGGGAENALRASVDLGHVLEEFAKGSVLKAVGAGAGTVSKVREFVFGHLGADLSVDAIANEMGCSGSYLRERFREESGISLGHFVRSVRLVRATHLLREGTQGVGEIAMECGFGSFTTFSRAFSQVYGMSPSEYRKTSRIKKGRG